MVTTLATTAAQHADTITTRDGVRIFYKDWGSGQPVAFSHFTTFPGEIFRAPRSWMELGYPSLTYFNEAERGGHFAAWEEPQLFSEEVRAAFRSLR